MADTVPVEAKIPGLEDLPPNMGVFAQYMANNGGYAPHHIAGMLGGLLQESGASGDLNPVAFNKESGASYIPQWFDRRPNYEAWTQANGGDKVDPVNQAQYTLNELATTENATDKKLRAAQTPEDSAKAWRGFERAGTDYGDADLRAARQLHDKFVQASQPQPQQQPADLAGALSQMQTGRGGPAPNPMMQPAPPPTDQRTSGLAGALSEMQRNRNQDPAGITARYGVEPGRGVLSGIQHFFATMPSVMARGLVDQLGMPADMLNASFNYFAHHPEAALAVGAEDPGAMARQDLGPGIPEGQSFEPVPGGATDIRKLAGKIGINTNLPSEAGDQSESGKWAETLGYALGSASPFMAANLAAKAPAAARMGKTLMKDAGLVTFSGGLGRELAENIEGSPGEKKLAEAAGQVGAPIAVVGALKAGGAVTAATTAAKMLATAGLQAAERTGNPLVRDIIAGHLNANAIVREMADNPQAAAANALAKGGVQPAGGELIPGMNVPAATASEDLPTQALMHQVAQKDREFNAQYREMLTGNEDLLNRWSPTGSDAGATDVGTHLQALQSNRIAAKQGLIDNAVKQADQDFEVATRGTDLSGLNSGEIQRAHILNLKGQLMDAWGNASAATQAEFQVAKDAGLAGMQVPTTRIYDKLSDMMAESIRTGNDDHFPVKAVSSLYDKPPLKMFGPDGSRLAGTEENNMLQRMEPWERIQGLYNGIDNELRNIMRSGGDPVKTQYLMRIQDEVMNAMKDLRTSGRFASGQVPGTLQNALNSAQENRRLFIDSPVGRLLGLNQNGLPVSSGQDLKAWLGNSPETMRHIQAMFDAAAPSSLAAGLHPGDQIQTTMKSYLRQDFADQFRTGGVTAANRWMNNVDATLNHPAFTDLRDEFRTSLNSRSVADDLSGSVPKEIEDIRRSRASTFMDADPEVAIQKALSGNNKFSATRELIQDLKQDPTGRALEGFGNMAFERMMSRATVDNPGGVPGGGLSGASAAKYYQQNRGMFDAIGREIPGYSQRVDQWVKSAQMMDRIMSKPAGIPLDQREISFSLTGMGAIMARVVGADLGRKLGTGTIQVPGIMANLAQKVYSQVASNIPAANAAKLVSKAMIEPETFAQLMQPMADPQVTHKTSMLLEPYVLSAPNVVVRTGQQYDNPQQPQ